MGGEGSEAGDSKKEREKGKHTNQKRGRSRRRSGNANMKHT
jgi:hypothetical protein